MSVIAFAGASQFAAVGYVAAGLPWLPIIVLTFFLNARHLLYSASLAPRLRARRRSSQRAAMAHVLTDEAFALAATHFHRVGRTDVPGLLDRRGARRCSSPGTSRRSPAYLLGGAIPDPAVFGLDMVFPAAMAGLAVGLMTGRREVVAAGAGAAIGVVASLAGRAVGRDRRRRARRAARRDGGARPAPMPRRRRGARARGRVHPMSQRAARAREPRRGDRRGRGRRPRSATCPKPPMPFGTFDVDGARGSDATPGREDRP